MDRSLKHKLTHTADYRAHTCVVVKTCGNWIKDCESYPMNNLSCWIGLSYKDVNNYISIHWIEEKSRKQNHSLENSCVYNRVMGVTKFKAVINLYLNNIVLILHCFIQKVILITKFFKTCFQILNEFEWNIANKKACVTFPTSHGFWCWSPVGLGGTLHHLYSLLGVSMKVEVKTLKH